MMTDKTDFQQDLIKWENYLAEYKNAFPKNFGMMFRKYLAYIMMLLSGFMLFDGLSKATVIAHAACLIAPVLCLFAVIMWIKTKKTFDKSDIKPNVLEHEVYLAETKYSKYPDVANLLRNYKASLSAETTRKKKIKNYFWICICAFFVAYGAMIYIDSKNELTGNVRTKDNYYQILGLETNKPFLSIQPLKTDIADGIQLQTRRLDVFLTYYEQSYYKDGKYGATYDETKYHRALKTQIPTISGNAGDDLFRLTITDETGKPIDRCPCFVFYSVGGGVVRSNDFPDFAYSLDYDFQAIHTLKYLQDNQEHLRYLVEKI